MKTSAFSQAGLLLFAGTAVVLIGALVKFVPTPAPAPPPVAAVAPPPSEEPDDSLEATNDVPLPANFPPALAQVAKLTRAGLSEDVIVAYVQNSPDRFAPTADEIIYLHQAGVSEHVMAAVVTHKPPTPAEPSADAGAPARAEPRDLASNVPPAATVAENSLAASPPPAAPSGDAAYFYRDLAPYGDWVQTGDSGWAWQPTIVQAVPDWRPYRDDGQWQYTDAGWYWQSSYPWGWAAFHYGRWWNDPARGWLWQPGNRWAPAWVTWRKTPSHFGWAPLPPGVSFNMEFALLQDRHLDVSEAGYGFTPSSFTFVPSAHFLSHNLAKHAVPTPKAATLAAASVPVVAKNRPAGLQPEEVAFAVHAPVKALVLRDTAMPALRAASVSAHDLAVYRPTVPTANTTQTKATK